MRECAAVSLSLDYHRLRAANNSAVKGRGADKGWSGGTPTCYQCSNDGALRNREKRMQGNTLRILLLWTTKKGWQSRISQGRHEAKTLWRTNWTHISQAHIKPLPISFTRWLDGWKLQHASFPNLSFFLLPIRLNFGSKWPVLELCEAVWEQWERRTIRLEAHLLTCWNAPHCLNPFEDFCVQ